ncbi:hypothetical protein ACSV5T_10335, partial [Veillonella sp. ZSJB6]|uniref:hypothetical protein n=1 Tax=Veillonella sp. ZSJB6 TaxID=3451359 RepID=UPI003EE78692
MIHSRHIRFLRPHISFLLTTHFLALWYEVNRTEMTPIYRLVDKIDNKSFLYIQLGRKTSY